MAKKSQSKKLIIGNWKMNPSNPLKAKEIFLGIRKTARDLNRVKTVICPPFVFISDLNKLFYRDQMALGAQDAFVQNEGSFTGQISPAILKSIEVSYVILGHSERRALGETNEFVNKKVIAVVREGMTAVLCVGEKQRDTTGTYLEFVKTQLKECLAGLQKKDLKNLVIAYEPVWAIGKSDKEAMQPADVHEMTIYIKKVLSDMFTRETTSSIPVLYGGSVTSRISEGLLRDGKVDGFLVGRQSLDPIDFSITLRQANEI